jgi:hypothetical protein
MTSGNANYDALQLEMRAAKDALAKATGDEVHPSIERLRQAQAACDQFRDAQFRSAHELYMQNFLKALK